MTSYIDEIKNSKKPVVIYGMGNGAEKIISHLNSFGISISGIFASDGFVRGQSFMGMKVKTLAETEKELGDFIIVTAFALEGDDVNVFNALSKKHTTYSPNLPPYGDGFINKGWLEENKEKTEKVYSLLCDNISRDIFNSLMEYNVTGKINCLMANFVPPEGWFIKNALHVDIGAYDGDSVLEYTHTNPDYGHIYAFEPEKHTFNKLVKNTGNLRNVTCINSAVWEKDGDITFETKKGRGSKISYSGEKVSCVSLDSYFAEKKPSSIKIDGEGAEREILNGGVNLIYSHSPSLCVAVYHRAFDIIDLPLWLHRQNPSYAFYLRRKEYVPAFDVFIYAIKK